MLRRIRGSWGRGAPAPRVFVAAMCAVAVSAGCQTSGGGGASNDTPSAGSPPTSSSAAATTLDTGNFPTKPRQPLGTAGPDGSMIEAQRMADFVTGPWEVDPTLTGRYSIGAAIVDPAQLAKVSFKEITDAFKKHDYINGFASSRQAEGQTILANAVLRFGTPEDAAAAANDMAEAARTMWVLTPPVEDAVIPGHPETQATRYTVTERDSGRRWSNVHAFTAHGPYVLLQTSESTDGFDKAIELVGKTLDAQVPLIDQFPATDPAKFADLPRDPTGLLARTLPAPNTLAILNATYGRRAVLHFQDNPVSSSTLFDETGMDTATFGLTNLYQARDAAGATKIAQTFVDEIGAAGQPTDAVKNLDSSKCVKLATAGFYCTVAADRFAVESSATQLAAAHQQLAAQYEMVRAK